jgi:hypothetical protein
VGPDEGRLKGLPGAQLACNARLLTSTSDLPHRDHIAIFISQTGCNRHANTVDGTPDRIRIPCAYRAVVAGCECPKSFRTVGRPKPLPTATLAKLCRKSVARQAFPIARRGCLIELLTSNGILAAASFLVGILPSKTLPHKQATFPLCAGLLRANEPKRRHRRLAAMRVAPAVCPFSIKIVRMVGDTAHLAASHH